MNIMPCYSPMYRTNANVVKRNPVSFGHIYDYYDPEDPQFITLAEAFKQRFKEHKFKPESNQVTKIL